jgi:hypothetical protein
MKMTQRNEVLLLDRAHLNDQKLKFVWSGVGYYQIEKNGPTTVFYFDSFPKKQVVAVRILLLIAFLALVIATAVTRFSVPPYAIAVPLAVIVVALIARYCVVKTQFKGARIEIMRDSCVLMASHRFELRPLIGVLLQIRSKTRDSHGISESGDRELFLKSRSPDGSELFLPVAVQGTVDRLAKDIAAAAGCALETQVVA